jgi:hypothetical protein
MRISRFFSGLFISALALFGFGALALAADKPLFYHSVAYAFEDAGAYGADMAKFAAVHAMLSDCPSVGSLGAGLRRDSHGYLQASADDFQGWNQNGTSQLSLT